MASMRLTVRVSVVSILLASLVLMGSGVMVSGAASASPSSCYPPGSTSCTGTLTAIPSTVVRGGTVTIIGKGFNGGANVSINVCNIKNVYTTASNVGIGGQIDVLITMPDNAPLGACKVTATGLGTNTQTLTLTTTVTVKSASETGTLKVMPSTVVRGETFTISGKGFTAGADVTINVCNVKKFTTVASNAGIGGQIDVLITMPHNAPLGACKVTATGPGTNKETLTLTGTVTVKSASETVLKLSPAKVTYGDEQVEVMSVKVSPEFAAPTPTGTVTISQGKASLCTITLLSGKGSCGLSAKEFKTAGTYKLVATYGGSSKFAGSFTKETLTVVK